MTNAHIAQGQIYVIGATGNRGPVKIGWSKTPLARLGNIQIGNPDDLVLIGSRAGTQGEEKSIHRRLAAARCRRSGEWFHRTSSVKAEIEAILAAGSPGPPLGRRLRLEERCIVMLRDDDANPVGAIVRYDDYVAMKARYDERMAKQEEAELIAAVNAARGDETFPAEVANRILDGEVPLKVIREWRHMTQAELANKAAVATQYISQLERRAGGRTVGKKAAKKLAPVLRVSADILQED